jgi:hypothetical protein
MSVMSCAQFRDALDGWMDGERSAEQDAHARECSVCRSLIQDLALISTSAVSLDDGDEAPPERLWLSLRAKLEKEGLIREPRQGWTQSLGRWSEGVFGVVPRPAIAGAYIAALLAVSLSVAGPLDRHFRQATPAAVDTEPLSAQLNSDEQDAISSLSNANPAVNASLQSSLAVLDNDISLCEKSVQENPDDEAARDYLYEAYQQKADLLAEISERGAFGR